MTGIYDVDIDKSYHLGRRLAFLTGTFMGIMSFLVFGASALVLWYGGYLVYYGQIAPGTLISLMLYTLNLAMCFAFLSNLYGEFMQVCIGGGCTVLSAKTVEIFHYCTLWLICHVTLV